MSEQDQPLPWKGALPPEAVTQATYQQALTGLSRVARADVDRVGARDDLQGFLGTFAADLRAVIVRDGTIEATLSADPLEELPAISRTSRSANTFRGGLSRGQFVYARCGSSAIAVSVREAPDLPEAPVRYHARVPVRLPGLGEPAYRAQLIAEDNRCDPPETYRPFMSTATGSDHRGYAGIARQLASDMLWAVNIHS